MHGAARICQVHVPPCPIHAWQDADGAGCDHIRDPPVALHNPCAAVFWPVAAAWCLQRAAASALQQRIGINYAYLLSDHVFTEHSRKSIDANGDSDAVVLTTINTRPFGRIG
jgi:hypothetical protein